MPVEDVDFPVDAPLPPAETSTAPRGPLAETTPESLVQEPHRGAAEDEIGGEETAPAVQAFDPRVSEPFEGLLYLGRLTDTFEAYGHRFAIRTLSTAEVLEIGLLHKPYRDSLSDVKAYQAALVAACVVSVDGKPLPLPVTSEAFDTSLLNRFEFVKRSWFPPLLDVIYERYLNLEAEVDLVLTAMGNPSR